LESKIVFIDGYCIMCNRLAAYVFKHDKKMEISVSALQGKTAETALPKKIRKNLDTVAYVKNGTLLLRSSAVLELLVDIGGWRKILGIFKIIPVKMRDLVYDYFANKRFKWFGKKDTCEIPSVGNLMYCIQKMERESVLNC